MTTTRVNTRVASSQFTSRILHALIKGPMRFNALDRAVEAPNPVRLSNHLKKLVRDGFVERRVLRLGPPAEVEYSLTRLGVDLAAPATALMTWIDDHIPEIQAAREYNARLVAGH